jgi:hypothetical protein
LHNSDASRRGNAEAYAEFEQRHCERSEAIHKATRKQDGLLRYARNDDGTVVVFSELEPEAPVLDRSELRFGPLGPKAPGPQSKSAIDAAVQSARCASFDPSGSKLRAYSQRQRQPESAIS